MSTPQPVHQLVTIGSSAGGIEALSALVASLSPDFPAAIVVAQHLDPTRPSSLQAILSRHSPLPVRTVVDHEALEAGVIYVVPSNRHITITDHHLSIDAESAGRPKPSIDLLFRTAAQAFGEGLIAIVLSGLGSDGAAGARYVKEGGGMVMIQDPRTASYPSMPQALAPTTVDLVADVAAMGPLLRDVLIGADRWDDRRDTRQLRAFLADLHAQQGIDFGQYKAGTIQRRLQRRLVATGTQSLAEYRAYLEAHPEEYDRLVTTFLIKVTEYFRDEELFAALRDLVLPEVIARGRAHGTTLRLWSAGCATGEEAYSLALLVAEALGDELERWTVRIFATDLDKQAVDFARRGVYPESALAAVPAALRTRYFVAEAGTYTVSKPVRRLLVFGEHDLGQQPAFPHIDLCLCRNVLIYFTPELQRRALEVFAMALRVGGYLALGKAETTSPLPGYFLPVDQRIRLYRRSGERLPVLSTERLAPPRMRPEHQPLPPAGVELARARREVQDALRAQLAAEELLLLLPVGVAVVDRNYDLVRLNNVARRLLGIHTPALGQDLLHLAQGVPSREVRAAIDAAVGGEARTLPELPSTTAPASETRYLRISCQPHQVEGTPGLVLLTIADVTEHVRARAEWEQERGEMARLRMQIEELNAANLQLLAANEALATSETLLRHTNEAYVLSSEEIQAATEEAETLNEELQSTNEELETLNEEQQATVEELETANEELQGRSSELQQQAAELDGQRRAVEEERARLTAILEGIGDAVLVVDPAGATVLTNPAYRRMFPTESLHAAHADADRPLPAAAGPIARAARGESFVLSFSLIEADGASRWFEARGEPVRSGGALRWGVVVIRDITERSLRRLQEEFVANVSHGFQTPITVLRASLGLLAEGATSLGDEEGALLAGARQQVEQLRAQIEDLLTANELRASGIQLERVPEDLRVLAADTAGVLRPLFREKGQQIRLDLPEPLPARVDARRMEQVLINLLTNAHRHTPAGSHIRIVGARVSDTVHLVVGDDGPGVPAEQLARIFQPFQRVSERGRGSGLGLSIAHTLVTLHDGRIWAEHPPEGGLTVHIVLPAAAEDPP